jgi:soluble lytic murein transglycosylase
VFRPGISGFLFLLIFLPFFLLGVSACGSAQVLGIPREEAAELLGKGDTGFIIRAELPEDFSQSAARLKQLSLIDPGAPFYAGLLMGRIETFQQSFRETEMQNRRSVRELALLLYCAALENPSPYARREAARKVIPLALKAENNREAGDILGFLDTLKVRNDPPVVALRAACLYRVGRYDEAAKLLLAHSLPGDAPGAYLPDEWDRALALFAAWRASSGNADGNAGNAEDIRQAILRLCFEIPFAAFGELLRWAYDEALAMGNLFTPTESMALLGRFSPGSYSTTLSVLRPTLVDGGVVFFRYPELIGELGRAYQYTPVLREEGAKLFAAWLRFLEAPDEPFTLPLFRDSAGRPEDDPALPGFGEIRAFIKNLDRETLRLIKFRILFYSGRIERARERYPESTAWFEQALEFAPDAVQSDACFWYMLMNAFTRNPAAAVTVARDTMPQWNDMPYFSDILDRLSAYLIGKRQWETILELFTSLESRGAGPSLSQYAWILGRAVEEGYVKTERSAESFFRLAFEEEGAPLYYRAMSAAKLGEAFIPEKKDTEAGKAVPRKEQDADLNFVLGFFKYGAASFAMPYIRNMEEKLSVPEKRKIAEALAATVEWQESLNLVSRYTGRAESPLSREDLLLFYPQPFRELVEKYAGETGLGGELLYGLIRTESYFMHGAVSRSGAVGLAQLMAPTAADMASRIARRGGPDYREPGGINLKEPEINIHIGSYYLGYLKEQMGGPMPALLAYNGGMGRVRGWLAADRRQTGGGLPHDLFLETVEISETREYGRKVLAASAVYGYLYYGKDMGAVAADFYP